MFTIITSMDAVELSLSLTKHYAMKTYRTMYVDI
jgi:hypothetical protein